MSVRSDDKRALENQLRHSALEVFQCLDVDGSALLEPCEITGWLVDVCGWKEEQVEKQLWGKGGMWSGKKKVGIDFETFTKAAVRFRWPIGDHDYARELNRWKERVRERA